MKIMRPNMMDSITQKAGIIAAAAFGVVLVSSAGYSSVSAQGLPEGFKKGDLSPAPSAEMIEAGKRGYFTKCVWCHGVDEPVMVLEPTGFGHARGISIKAHSKFAIRQAANSHSSMLRSL
jgi:mono/diheme cytochrome c family protein